MTTAEPRGSHLAEDAQLSLAIHESHLQARLLTMNQLPVTRIPMSPNELSPCRMRWIGSKYDKASTVLVRLFWRARGWTQLVSATTIRATGMVEEGKGEDPCAHMEQGHR